MSTQICSIVDAVWIYLLLHGALGQLSWETKSTNETIKKGETVTFNCGVDGRQDETISWFKESSEVSQNQNVHTEFKDRYSISGEFNLVISNVQPSDSGQYTCNVNSLGNHSVYLTVLHEPVVWTKAVKVNVHLNYSAWFSCFVQANPSPSIYWFKDGARVYSSDNLYITTRQSDSIYISKLVIMKAKLQDLGGYTCWAGNEIGNNSQNFILDQKTVPVAPTNVTLLNKTWDSVLLAWNPSFNGGLSQTFVINVTIPGNETRLVNVWPPTASLYNVTRLKPEQLYEFEIIGKNDMGLGEPSEGINVETEALYIPSFTEIEFDLATGQLMLDRKIPKNHFIRLFVKYSNTGDEWKVLYKFMHFQHLSTRIDVPNITALQIFVCLNGRSDVCGDPVLASIKNPARKLGTGAIVGICIAIIVLLVAVVVMVYLFFKRRNVQKGDMLS